VSDPVGPRVDAFDGLRAVAVIAVIAFHASLGLAPGGYLGVDVFFVLSGFLITGLLHREMQGTGRIDLVGFWFRRVRRLVPAALVTIVGASVMFALVATNPAREAAIPDARAATLWFANWHFVGEAADYFRGGVDESPFLHFWSLSVEEQFYVMWPVLVVGAVALPSLRRLLRRRWVLVAVPSVAAAYAYLAAGNDPLRAYYATDTRVYQLFAGAALAVWIARSPRPADAGPGHTGSAEPQFAVSDRGSVATTLLTAVEWLVVGGVGAWLLVDGDVAPRDAGLITTLVVVWVLLRLAPTSPFHQPSVLSTMLSRPTPVRVGRLSYGVYLWHWPVIVVAGRLVETGAPTRFVIALAGALALASASWMFVEVPVQQWTRRIRRRRGQAMVVVAGVASSLAVAFVAVPLAFSDQLPLLRAVDRPGFTPVQQVVPPTMEEPAGEPTDGSGVDADAPAPDGTTGGRGAGAGTGTGTGSGTGSGVAGGEPPPTSAAVAVTPVPDGMGLLAYDEQLAESSRCIFEVPDDVNDCIVVDNGGTRVLVVGDSHAARLAPAFTAEARRSGGTVATVIGFGCPWQTTLFYEGGSNDGIENQCRSLRADLLERVLPQYRPDVVVAVGHPTLEPGWTVVTDTDPVGAPIGPRELAAPTLASLQEMAAATTGTAEFVVVLPLPSAPYEPLECLDVAAVVEDCAFATTATTFDEWRAIETAVAGAPAARTATIHDIVCPRAPVCDAIVDGMLVRDDRDHLYHGFVQRHATELVDRILDPA